MSHLVRIDRTWSGAPLPPGQRSEIRLAAAGDHLRLDLDAPFHGDPPPAGAAGPTPGLWNHEVVELFVAGEGDGSRVEYLEVELSPHGHHLVLRLRGVRRVVEQGLALDFAATIDGRRWRGVARLPGAWLPAPPHHVAAFAVHGSGPSRHHHASLTLPGDRPDFHQPERFPRVGASAGTSQLLAT